MNLYCWGRPHFTVNMRGGGEVIEKITVSIKIIGCYQSVQGLSVWQSSDHIPDQ